MGIACKWRVVLFAKSGCRAKGFETSSMISKVAFLAPSFLMDLSYYDSFLTGNNALLPTCPHA